MAVVIGLDKYQFQARLPGAVRNADAMSSRLRWQYKFEVAALADAQVTRGAITRELGRLAEADRAVIYYAGRALDNDTLCLYSTEAGVSNSGLSLDRLLHQIKAFAARHILLILDTTIERPDLLESLDVLSGDLESRSTSKARIILASGPTAWKTRDRWGDEDATPFTAQVLHGLHGSARDATGAITAGTLAAHVAAELPRNSGGKAGTWAGRLPGFTGDLVFREYAPAPLPYDIENGLRSALSFHRYRAVELLAYLIDKADPVQSVVAIDKLREVANDNDSANVRKMAVDELMVRHIDPYAGNVPMLREPTEPRTGNPGTPPASNAEPPALPGDRRQTLVVVAIIGLTFLTVAFLILYFRT